MLGSAVRFSRGAVRDVLVAGEGLETVLSLRRVLPRIPMAAGTSASHLAAIALPSGLRCLYVARDRDPAGVRALEILRERARGEGIPEVRELAPLANDLNVDLTVLGPEGLAAYLALQLDPQDAARHLCVAARGAYQAA